MLEFENQFRIIEDKNPDFYVNRFFYPTPKGLQLLDILLLFISVSLSTHVHSLYVPVRERLRTHSIESSGKLKISPEQHWDFTAEDLKDLGEIGRGAYGSVNKMVHKPSNQIMAVKVIYTVIRKPGADVTSTCV